MPPHTGIRECAQRGRQADFLQRSHSEPPAIMQEGGPSVLGVIAKGRGPAPGKAQRGDNIRKVSETDDRHDTLG